MNTADLVDSMISASKKQRFAGSSLRKLDHMSRMIIDSRLNKKPSEYQPEDFIPRTGNNRTHLII